METTSNTNAKVMGGIVLIGGLAALWYLFFRNENKKTLSGSDGAVNELLMFIGERYPGKKVTHELISKAAKEYTKEFEEMEGTKFQWSKLFPRNVRKKVLVKTSEDKTLSGHSGYYQTKEIGKKHFVTYRMKHGEVMIMSNPYKTKAGAEKAMAEIKKQAGS